jgi:hypothetical protein
MQIKNFAKKAYIYMELLSYKMFPSATKETVGSIIM